MEVNKMLKKIIDQIDIGNERFRFLEKSFIDKKQGKM